MQERLKYDDGIWFYPFIFTLFLWFIKAIEVKYNIYLIDFGIFPRTIKGLRGILLAPFIHANIKHLWANTIPFFITTGLLYYFYRNIFWKIIPYAILMTGLLTWLIARSAYHIGVSGLIYSNVSFLFFGGVFSKNYRLMAVSLLIIFLYGGMIWYVFPTEEGISWEGHLMGLFSGFALVYYYKSKLLQPEKKYQWQQENYSIANDEFMQSFDENGNFIDPPKVEETPETKSTSDDDSISITNFYKAHKDS